MKMQQWNKKAAAIMAATVLTAVVSGCSGDGNGDKEGDSGKEIFNATGMPIVNEPITLTMMVSKSDTDRSSWMDKEAIKIIERDTGIKLDITEVPAMAWNEKIGVTIASGDLPDVIIGGIPNLTLNKGSLMPLNDLIEQYSPTLVELYKKHPEYKFAGTLPDDNLYSLPLLQTKSGNTGVNFSINQEWLDKLQLKVPETTEELYQTLKAFKEKDPNGNGKKDEIPYSFYTDENYGLDAMLWHFGLVNDETAHVMVEDGKMLFVPADNRYLDYLRFLHKLYAEGLIDPDGFVQKSTDLYTKGNKGLLGLFNHHSYADIAVGTEKAEHYTDILPMKDSNGEITVLGSKFAGDLDIDQFAISVNSKYPEAIVRMYEYINSDFERMMTMAFGRKDVIWKENADGKWEKITTLPEGINNFAEFRHTESPGMKGFYLLKDEDIENQNVTDPRDLREQDKNIFYKPYLKEEVIPKGMDTIEAEQEKNNMFTEIDTYIQNFLAQSVLKGVDDKQWAAHLDKLEKLNIKRYVELYQSFYDRSQSFK
ncbi:hypothetical protein B1748_12940 [Paenibacillus sp. MY03]|uniref:extracellular solute-binding protein n=1 Tax=Paenibacillus sp. MY03 TaxID=302980 RepID=UPI000B3C3A95|nr:extracellular solute-binding protein [Paenibacillus sp. MY03]OUS76168.1 hypothetical protein B1748_12940 [Paenibacillus sp. MY03]